MHTLTDDELQCQPERLIDDARRGEPALVTVDGEPVMMTVPLGKGITSPAVRLELAVHLFDSEQISVGLAAHIAGVPYGDMVDELGRRRIPVLRCPPEDLASELDILRGAAGR
jgi:predicted HTH domain antitoxin